MMTFLHPFSSRSPARPAASRRLGARLGGLALSLLVALGPPLSGGWAFVPDQENGLAGAVTAQAHFNDPRGGMPDDRLEDVLIALVDSVPAGAELRGAFYSFSRQRVARAFVRAQARGVDVQLVLDGSNAPAGGPERRAVALLRDGLGTNLTLCGRAQYEPENPEERGGTACLGAGIQHNKFVLISELAGGRRALIWQTSANPTNPQRMAFNDAVLLAGDVALHAGLRRYWQALQAGTSVSGRPAAQLQRIEGDSGAQAHLFPREEGDPVVEILDRVRCRDGGAIHLAMSRFTTPRRAIAERLVALGREGCAVTAILRARHSSAAIRRILAEGGVGLWVFPPEAVHGVHSKYLLIDAPMVDPDQSGAAGDRDAEGHRVRLVVTGSHNYNAPALRRHDELLLEIPDAALHAAYLQNWHMLRARVQAGDDG